MDENFHANLRSFEFYRRVLNVGCGLPKIINQGVHQKCLRTAAWHFPHPVYPFELLPSTSEATMMKIICVGWKFEFFASCLVVGLKNFPFVIKEFVTFSPSSSENTFLRVFVFAFRKKANTRKRFLPSSVGWHSPEQFHLELWKVSFLGFLVNVLGHATKALRRIWILMGEARNVFNCSRPEADTIVLNVSTRLPGVTVDSVFVSLLSMEKHGNFPFS